MPLAHEGPAAWRDRYELALRRQAERPNQMWQADHTQLDILILDADGAVKRPWLTVVLDDHSRAVRGYTVFLGAPSALNLSLAMRQAIWFKTDPGWAVHGLPEVLYADHGSDFTSHHLAHVLRGPARPPHPLHRRPTSGPRQGGADHGLDHHRAAARTSRAPRVRHVGQPAGVDPVAAGHRDRDLGHRSLHRRPHSETGIPPQQAWLADGWLPRTPDSLEALDLLLVMVATPRTVHRDGIRFEGLRYHSPVLAPYVGISVTIRYDPRDLSEIRVFHRDRLLCRAISPEHAGETITLKDVQTARVAHRRALREQITTRRATVAEYLPAPGRRLAPDPADTSVPQPPAADKPAAGDAIPPTWQHRPTASRLRLYQVDSQPGPEPAVDLDEATGPTVRKKQP